MYSMKEACELTDMTYENLKFYCNEGLVPNVKRDKRNYRVLQSIEKLQQAVAFIDWKQNFYDNVLSGETKYYSNLLSELRE